MLLAVFSAFLFEGFTENTSRIKCLAAGCKCDLWAVYELLALGCVSLAVKHCFGRYLGLWKHFCVQSSHAQRDGAFQNELTFLELEHTSVHHSTTIRTDQGSSRKTSRISNSSTPILATWGAGVLTQPAWLSCFCIQELFSTLVCPLALL